MHSGVSRGEGVRLTIPGWGSRRELGHRDQSLQLWLRAGVGAFIREFWAICVGKIFQGVLV